MRTYWESEAPENPYYIKYKIIHDDYHHEFDEIIEFWTDDEEEFKNKLGFVERHIGNYSLLDKRVPVC